jgi:hypothetical protein
VQVKGAGSASLVRFWWRKVQTPIGSFTATDEITTNTPGSEARLQFSAACQTQGATPSTMALSIFEFDGGAIETVQPLEVEQFGYLGTLGLNVIDSGTTDPDSDWYVQFDNGATVARDAEAVHLDLTGTSQAMASLRLKPTFWSWHGKSLAAFRVSVNCVSEVGFYLGLSSKDNDPFNGYPEFFVGFTKDATGLSSQEVRAYARNGSADPDSAFLFNMSSNQYYDLVVEYDADGGNPPPTVRFWWRTAGYATPFTGPVELDDDDALPPNRRCDKVKLHYTVAGRSDPQQSNQNAKRVSFKLLEFRADTGDLRAPDLAYFPPIPCSAPTCPLPPQ